MSLPPRISRIAAIHRHSFNLVDKKVIGVISFSIGTNKQIKIKYRRATLLAKKRVYNYAWKLIR